MDGIAQFYRLEHFEGGVGSYDWSRTPLREESALIIGLEGRVKKQPNSYGGLRVANIAVGVSR